VGKQVDVLVIGAGPAGATAALNLAPYRSVSLVNARAPSPRVGESLVPAARRLLRDMGLFDAFCRLPLSPWYANSAVWENSIPE
jgi:2-polyprenyl-6-methoxyphenol hydroxylase-like FAD-dependent oxidoreductase